MSNEIEKVSAKIGKKILNQYNILDVDLFGKKNNLTKISFNLKNGGLLMKKPTTSEIMNILVEIKSDIIGIKADIVEMKEDIVEMKADIVEMKEDIVEMKADIVEIKEDILLIKSLPTIMKELVELSK